MAWTVHAGGDIAGKGYHIAGGVTGKSTKVGDLQAHCTGSASALACRARVDLHGGNILQAKGWHAPGDANRCMAPQAGNRFVERPDSSGCHHDIWGGVLICAHLSERCRRRRAGPRSAAPWRAPPPARPAPGTHLGAAGRCGPCGLRPATPCAHAASSQLATAAGCRDGPPTRAGRPAGGWGRQSEPGQLMC